MADQSPMKAGRELDALIAEKVMGWERRELFDKVLNPAWVAELGNTRISADETMPPAYIVTGKADYLCCPGRFAGSPEILARETIGTLTVGGDQDLPHYSTDIATAWTVVEKMRERGWVECYIDSYSPKQRVGFAANFWRSGERGGNHCSASTAPLAICRAALAAIVPPTPGA